jgi:hypothetical protein
MPQTMQFFGEQPQEDTYEFYRYHGLQKRTYENALMFLYGIKAEELEGQAPAQKRKSII